ncbi:hypothetical protein [Protaetiibacter larvae]|uniref:Uncharacterized protein n=1 Tax=Protaetiibacter larvae TaxID=2592654 RepID=A0A5C1Y6J9_9MICO|nr:hypothetical protein [Protaetiibacter larvae]QEO09416.1 hypothetical protein FLP23_04980 [Protaetiibacter larvae]
MAGAIAVSFGLTASLALAPPAPPSAAAELRAYVDAHAQGLRVSPTAAAEHLEATGVATRDSYTATPGIASLAASGTNYDWAKLVLVFAGWPITDANVTVLTRWMRQENSPKNWWNRNNPLNNGWGASYGPGGTGSNVSLVAAAENAADALLTHRGYAGIRAAFADGSSTAAIESAIWASPWATGHYANGGHWHYTPVDVVQAPASAWG